MIGSTEISLVEGDRQLYVSARKNSFSLIVDEYKGGLKGYTQIFRPRALYACDLRLEDLKSIFEELTWITLLEE